MKRPAAPAPAPLARVERVIVRAPGDAAAGARLAERLPAALDAAVRAAGASDPRALRAAIATAVREAAR